MNLDARMIPRALVIRRVLVALVTAVCAGVAGGAEAFAAETTIGHEIRGAGALERLVIEVEGPIAPGTADRVAAIPRRAAVRAPCGASSSCCAARAAPGRRAWRWRGCSGRTTSAR